MKVTFLTKRQDHQVDHPLITVINDPWMAIPWFVAKGKATKEDETYHKGWIVLAHDIETQAEFPTRDKLLLSAFCVDGEHVIVVDNTSVNNNEVFTPQLLGSCLFISHNADFEARWGAATGFLPERYACTMVNDRRLQSGMEGYRYDLVSTINRRLGPEAIPEWMDKDIRSQFADCTYFTAEQILYNAADTIRLKSLYYQQRQIAINLGMDFLIGTINSRIIIPIAQAEVTGIKHDGEAWRGIARERQVKAETICQELTKTMIGQYGVDLEKINPSLLKERLANEKRSEKKLDREIKLKEQLRRLEEQGKTHLKSYRSTEESLAKLLESQSLPTTSTPQEINWGSQKQVLAALNLIGCPLPQAKDKKTRKLKEGVGKDARSNWFVTNQDSVFEPLMKQYDDYKKVIHNVNSFGENWLLQYVNPLTGRVHTALDQAGADTGRFSSGSKGRVKKYPNLQQVPKPPEYRRCFIADEGRAMLTLDYKNCEGVIMIAQSGDLNMKKITELKDQHSFLGTKCWRNVYKNRYNKTGDVKWNVLAETYEMNQSTPEKKKERDIFKNSGGLFPVAYGVYASKVAGAAKVTVEEGQIFIDTIKGEIPLVVVYLDSVAKRAVKDGYVVHNKRTGSRRWFQPVLDNKHYGWRLSKDHTVEIESAGRNSVIQGTNSDIIKEAIAWLTCWAKIFKQDVRFLLTVHDELVLDCPWDKKEFYLEKVINIMRRVAKNYLIPEIDMEVDAHADNHWHK